MSRAGRDGVSGRDGNYHEGEDRDLKYSMKADAWPSQFKSFRSHRVGSAQALAHRGDNGRVSRRDKTRAVMVPMLTSELPASLVRTMRT